MPAIKGWKTVAFGLFLVLVPPALSFLGAVDWQSLGISPGISAAIGVAIISLRALTSTPIGRAAIVGPLLVVTALGLSACSPQQVLTSEAASVAVSQTEQHVSTASISRLEKLCDMVQPLADRGIASSSRTAQILGQFGTAYCGKLLAGTVPATTDGGTENWLMRLLDGLRGVG